MLRVLRPSSGRFARDERAASVAAESDVVPGDCARLGATATPRSRRMWKRTGAPWVIWNPRCTSAP